MPWGHVVIIAAVQVAFFLLYVVTELHANGKLGFPLDDPWIHLTFARNLASGWGFAFNHGEPVQGSTAPLWTLILALFHLFTRSAVGIVWIAKLLGAGFLFLAALFAARIARFLTGRNWAGLAAGIAVISFSHLGLAMVSGMEVTLVACLTMAGVYFHVVPHNGRKRYLPWVFFALAVYARPESILLLLFLVLDILIRRLAFRHKALLWRGLVVWIVVVLPYFILNLTLVHSLFPQTYVAKVGRTSLFSAMVLGDAPRIKLLLFKAPATYLAGFVMHLWRANPILTLLAPVGIIVLIARFVRDKGSTSLFIPLVAMFFASALGMTAPYGSPTFQNGRYLGSPLVLAILAAIMAAAAISDYRRAGQQRAQLAWPQYLVILLAILAAFNTVSTGLANSRNTALQESSINRQQVAIGEWLAENTPADATVACDDVGAIGYFAHRRVFDLLGLVTPELMPYRRKYEIKQENLAALDFIKDKKPDFLVIFPSWFPNLQQAKFLTPVYVSDIRDNYASHFDFQPKVKSIAGVLILGLELEPIRSTTVVFRCDWAL